MRILPLLLLIVASACRTHGATTTPGAPPPIPASEIPLGPLPRTVVPLAYTVELEIVPARSEFSGRTQIAVQVSEPTSRIWLHGRDLDVSSARVVVGDTAIAAHYREVDATGVVSLDLEQEVPAGSARIELEYRAEFGAQLSGLYRVQSGEAHYAFTQFEPLEARRAFPCFDEPAFKTPFDIYLTVPTEQVAITNTPQADFQPVPGDLKRLRFARTKPLPTYLIGFSVGPFDVVDGGMRGDCQLKSDPNRILLGGWAPGTPGRNYEPEVGQELPFGPNTMVTLEVHYFNSKPGEPALDRSGGELCLSSSPRPNVATPHWLGTENINVPPRTTETVSDICTPGMAGSETATVLSITPHMHEIGAHAKLEILRAGGEIDVIHDEPFSFENQVHYYLDPPAIVNKGDQLRASCTFNNTGDGVVTYGDGTNEEMCYLFLTAYPAGALHNGKTGCFGPFCGCGGKRR